LPAYDLDEIKFQFKSEKGLLLKPPAINGMHELRFGFEDVIDAIQAIKASDFHKSMTPDSLYFTSILDVYRPTFRGIELYIKFQKVSENYYTVSFKKR